MKTSAYNADISSSSSSVNKHHPQLKQQQPQELNIESTKWIEKVTRNNVVQWW